MDDLEYHRIEHPLLGVMLALVCTVPAAVFITSGIWLPWLIR